MTDAREIERDLAFLGEGRFEATLWRDRDVPAAVQRQRPALGVHQASRVHLAGGGGAALRFMRG
ncbi:hypothetical protein [Luteimonas sp. SDU101]|uniref:hypothetical protein n=1 Tax=Luteimonas sp. SDU101 TaxID=3422593 RepID=UPI003EBBFA96